MLQDTLNDMLKKRAKFTHEVFASHVGKSLVELFSFVLLTQALFSFPGEVGKEKMVTGQVDH